MKPPKEPLPTTLPAIVDARDLPELYRRLRVRRVRCWWPDGAARPTLEVEDISTEMESEDGLAQPAGRADD